MATEIPRTPLLANFRPAKSERIKRKDRIAELEGELRKWLEIYARSASGLTIAVPVYQIERLLKSN